MHRRDVRAQLAPEVRLQINYIENGSGVGSRESSITVTLNSVCCITVSGATPARAPPRCCMACPPSLMMKPQACYFGHANCARILILAGANVNAKDCYGNTPSQIFDDHVTEPVLDEVPKLWCWRRKSCHVARFGSVVHSYTALYLLRVALHCFLLRMVTSFRCSMRVLGKHEKTRLV